MEEAFTMLEAQKNCLVLSTYTGVKLKLGGTPRDSI